MTRQGIVLAAFVYLVLAPAWAVGGAEPLTQCGHLIDGKVELVADLDCSGLDDDAVDMIRGRLDLNGFTLTGIANSHPEGERARRTFHCQKRCRIRGPGAIRGGGFHGAVGGAKLTIDEVDISDNPVTGIHASRLRLRRSTVNGNGKIGIITVGKRLKIRDSEVSGNGSRGIMTFGEPVKARLRDATITNNAGHGILASDRLRVKRSTLTGNATSEPGCDYFLTIGEPCADITTSRKPYASATTCDTSVDFETGEPWGICSLD